MYVGVILRKGLCGRSQASIPHVRGGDPWSKIIWVLDLWYSPCTWGWSRCNASSTANLRVFPMYVGVIPPTRLCKKLTWRIPHVRGGDPKPLKYHVRGQLYSPCMWGWSQADHYAEPITGVFPMYVGGSHIRRAKLSHFSYGMLYNTTINFWYSPCVWGWSWNDIQWDGYPSVFPILVGAIYY